MWTPDDDDRLRNIWEPGQPWSDDLLAQFPGRSKAAIQRRASHLGLTRKTEGAPWTEEENAILRAHYPALGQGTITHLPGRTGKAVKLQADRLGIIYTGDGAKLAGPDWSPKEDQIIRDYYPVEGSDCKSRMLRRRSDSSVRARAHELDVTRRYR